MTDATPNTATTAMVVSNVNNDNSNRSISATNNINTPTHYIKQTLVGAICTHCNTKVCKTKSNFAISDDTLREYFKANNCNIALAILLLQPSNPCYVQINVDMYMIDLLGLGLY
jgi:hypothetical protein